MDFSVALLNLKNGLNISRIGWNGKGMYVYLREASEGLNSHLVLKNAQGTYDTWIPSISDLLATDWCVSGEVYAADSK